MEKYKEITTIKKINKETGKEETTEREINYIIKTWDELTREEKEQEIDKSKEFIYEAYQEELSYIFKDTLEIIKEKYNNINFENVYIDSNSQGNWIDSVEGLQFDHNITIFGNYLEINYIDLVIRKYIENINENDIILTDYYIENEELEKIKNTKKYKNFINETVKDINNWINEINAACAEIMKNEYYFPYNLNDPDDSEWLSSYFDGEEFIIYEEEKEGEK